MSRYSDINQLLEEIGTSARSASDPWTLSRSDHGVVARDSFSPAVIADMGEPRQQLTSAIQSSEQITNADIIASSPNGASGSGSTSTGSGFLGGLLNFFPLASGIAKLFGFGGSSSPPSLTPYELPPSINFEGAVSNATSGVTSLSYGADGLPRTTSTTPSSTTPLNTPTSSNFDAGPASALTATLSSIGQPGPVVASNDPTQANGSNAPAPNVMTQLMALAGSTQTTDMNETNSTFNSGLMSTPGIQNSAAGSINSGFLATPGIQSPDTGSLSFQQNVAGNSTTAASVQPTSEGNTIPGLSSSSSQQGQSILVQVQAMDSQSFMDHSQEIAQAVRQAMLNMNSLNDVILDL